MTDENKNKVEFIFVLGGKNNGNEQLILYLKYNGIKNISDYLQEGNSDSELFVNIYISLKEITKNRKIEFLIMPDVKLDRFRGKIEAKNSNIDLGDIFEIKDYFERIDKMNSQQENQQNSLSA